MSELVEALASGERRPLAQLLTRIERGDPSLRPLLPQLFGASRGAHLVGITGPPGSGKSTLVSALIGEWRRRGRRVGVLAVDPSSPYTGGAILGDRIRMMEHAADRDVFMRSMAARGELGGLAATTWIAAAALDAAGYDPILVETVGAGQSEVEIARLAETTVVVEVPEMGDEVQAIKAGLLEVADIIAVNKGDRPGADRAARQLRAMLSTAGGRITRTPPPVLMTTATTGEGVAALADAVEAHRSTARTPVAAHARAAHQLRRAVADLAARRATEHPDWQRTLDAIAAREVDPLTAAESLLAAADDPLVCQPLDGASDGRRDLHLEQELLGCEPVHDEQRVRRIGAIGKELRELALAPSAQSRDVLAPRDEGHAARDVAPLPSGRPQRHPEILEDLVALPLEVADADDVSVAVHGDLPGDLDRRRARARSCDVRVGAAGRSEAIGVEDFDRCHVFRSCVAVASRHRGLSRRTNVVIGPF